MKKHPLQRVLVVLSWWEKDMAASPRVVAAVKRFAAAIKKEIARDTK